jgi:hypothetical protein
LHLDRANEDPDLILREAIRIRCCQVLQFFRHRRVLIGGHLQLEPGALPRVLQGALVAERVELIDGVGQQQAEPGHVLRRGMGLQPLDLLSQLRAGHRVVLWLIHVLLGVFKC